MEPAEDGQLLCLYCGSFFGEVTRICPNCGHYNEEGIRHCSQCGTRIIRDCPVCGADNWVLAEHCGQCGRNIDMISQMARRWQLSTQQRLNEQRAAVTAIKKEQERASQERMAALMEAERIRQEAIALARETQRQRDRQMYVWGAVALGVFLIVAVLILLLTSGGS
jgi:uncharacterized membrane protein YvbJ